MNNEKDNGLKWVIVGVASIALIISLFATIFGRNSEFREVALLFSGISAFVFGAHIFSK